MHCFEELESTSAWLRSRERGATPAWTVAWAATQTRGRGRQGRTWQSPRGNLYLSVSLPAPSASAPGLLPLAAGVAVAQALAGWGVPARLKWPNDVLLGDRKLAGILIEASSYGGALEQVILGIGVNLSVTPRLEDPGAQAPTSMEESLGRAPDVASVGAAVLKQVVQWHARLADQPAAVRAAWRSLSADWWDEAVEIRTPAHAWEGVLRGLSDEGGLLVELPDGRLTTVTAGEVLRLRRAPVSSGGNPPG